MKIMKELLVCLSLLSAGVGFAQDYQWAKQLGSLGNSVTATAVVADPLGNVYSTGYFLGTVDFNPGASVVNLVSSGGNDIYIQKLDAGGNFLWAKNIGGTGSDQAFGIALDNQGNVYTTGSFTGTVDFDPSAVTNNLIAAGSSDIFISKMDASGNSIYAKQFGGTSADNACAISVDASGNIYASGYFNGTSDFDPGATVANLVSAGSSDIFVSKMDAFGNYLWAKCIGGNGDDLARAMVVDAAGAVYFTGSFRTSADFDPGLGTANLTSAGLTNDIFVCKLDAFGAYVWAKGFGGNTNNPLNADNPSFPAASERGCSIALDAVGNVYTTGYFQGTADFDPGVSAFNISSAGSTDIFYQKLSNSGAFIWAKSTGSNAIDAGYGLCLDAEDNLFVTGFYSGAADFDPGAGTTLLTPAGASDIFVSRLDAAGTMIWAQSAGGTGSDISNCIAVKNFGHIITAGTFTATADFNPSVATNALTALGTLDAFVCQWRQSIISNLAPVITSFSPVSGPIGTTVTITGSNFNPIAANNVVYFGSVKATVSAATATSLTVTAPIGANYESLTATNLWNGLSGQSRLSFDVTFTPNNGFNVTANDFDPVANIVSSVSPSPFLSMADFDGDGKIDIANAASSWLGTGGTGTSFRTIKILRNVATPGSVLSTSFSEVLSLTALKDIDHLVLGDVDGDGKTDIVTLFDQTSVAGATAMNVYRNTSVPGAIGFELTTIPCELDNSSSAILADFNGDGKPDLAQFCGNSGTNSGNILLYENTSSVGNCNFSSPIVLNTNATCAGCRTAQMDAGDIDGDGRIDLVYSDFWGSLTRIIKNNTPSGALIATNFSILSTTLPKSGTGILLSDLDGDGKLDFLAAPDGNQSSLRINRNTSTPGAINFSGFFAINTGSNSNQSDSFKSSLHSGDLTGDGKIDVFMVDQNSTTCTIFTNKLIVGQTLSNTSFQVNNLSIGAGNTSPLFIDIDGDGRLDIIGRSTSSATITARRYDPNNILTGNVPSQFCPGAQVVVPFTANQTANGGNVYTAQLSNSAGSFAAPVAIGALTSTALSGSISCLIPANTLAGTAYRIRVVSSNPAISGTDNGSNLAINALVLPTVTISASQTSICISSSVTYIATNTNGGSAPSYQWKKNGVNVGTNSAIYTNPSAQPGDVVYVVMTISSACNTSVVNSASIVLNAVSTVFPSVSITASQSTICATSTQVVYTATPVNGGVSPSYQWYKNGALVSTAGATYTDLAPSNGNAVYVILTSNANCLGSASIPSNTLTLSYAGSVIPTASIAASQTTICPTTTQVVYTATIANGGTVPSFQWIKNGVNTGANSPIYVNNAPAAGDIVSLNLTSTATCASPVTVQSNSITLINSTLVVPSVSISSSPILGCSALDQVSFTATPTNGGTLPNYQWKKNGVNVGANTPFYVGLALASGDSIQVILSSNATCASPATAADTLIVSVQITWTGATDTDWHKACNWSPQVLPQQCNSVVIPFTARQPIISQVASCKDITINTTDGAMLTVNNTANLQIETCPLAATVVACP